MTHRLNIFLLLLTILIAAPFYWFLLDNSRSGANARPLEIAQLRSLANQIPGPRPTAVEVEVIAVRRIPGDYAAVGIGLKREPIASMAFRLPVPGARPVMIDTGVIPALEPQRSWVVFDPKARSRADVAMREAALILATDEHSEHNGALHARLKAQTLSDPIGRKYKAIAAQRIAMMEAAGRPIASPAGPAGQLAFAVAPGIVVIPTPGHSPGAQMVYVRLASGREYLFAGDNAIFHQSWAEQRNHSRLMSDWLEPEDRVAVRSWLITIARLHRQAPKLVIVPGGDYQWLLDERNGAGAKLTFSQDPA